MARTARTGVYGKFLPKDALVARRDGLWPIRHTLPPEGASDGPTGPRAVVVDYNADLDTRFAPVKLQKNGHFARLEKMSDEKLLDDLHFHQVNVWTIVERTLGLIENKYALARTIPWASNFGRLVLIPHAGYMENAFYSRDTGALHFFYFEGPDGKPVYTCLHHDIIAHELGHAVLDGLKPYYNEVCSAQTSGFHEYFGDAMAMMASLNTREVALVALRNKGSKLTAKNVVSAIASEFGAAIHGMAKKDYLRGAWNKKTMAKLAGEHEEHDWSEILTGVYYDLLEYLHPKFRRRLQRAHDLSKGPLDEGMRRHYSVRALFQAASTTSAVMFRALDYCPPADLRYDEYARAILKADAVAYPIDLNGVRDKLQAIFKARGIKVPREDPQRRTEIQAALRNVDAQMVASTPADAYRFLDARRALFRIPFDANFCVINVYRTNKATSGGYRPPREHIIEFLWEEDVLLKGRDFGPLSGARLPLYCGGTLVFDTNGNFLHEVAVTATDRRRRELKEYIAYLVEQGELGIVDGVRGIGAPNADQAKIRATIEAGRVRLKRNAAMRHHHSNGAV